MYTSFFNSTNFKTRSNPHRKYATEPVIKVKNKKIQLAIDRGLDHQSRAASCGTNCVRVREGQKYTGVDNVGARWGYCKTRCATNGGVADWARSDMDYVHFVENIYF